MKVIRIFAPVILLFMLVFTYVCSFSTAHAATEKASANITVKSTSGNVIAYANVIFTSSALPFPLTVRTDANGIASFPNLPIGDFTLTASANYFRNSSIQSGTLTAGQAFEHTFCLTDDNTSIGLSSLSINDHSSSANEFEGTVSWSTYGTVPIHSEMRLQFMDNGNTPIGSVLTSVYSDERNFYTSTITNIALPSGATRLGITLLDSNSCVLDSRTVPLWHYNLHAVGSLKFRDTHANGGMINARVTWAGANDEASLAGYNIYYWVIGDNQWKYWDTVAKKSDGAYEYVFDAFPAGTGAILVGSVNSAGEEYSTYPTVNVMDNRQADTLLSADYSGSLPMPSNIQDYTYTINAHTISGSISFALPSEMSQIRGYNLYFSSANGDKLQALATIYSPRSYTQLFYMLDDNQPVPANATQFALYSYGNDGKESAPIFIPVKNSVLNTKLPPNMSFVDMDEQADQLRGFLTWDRAADESNLHSYQIYFLDSFNRPISLVGEVLKGAAPMFTLPEGFSIPHGATSIGIGVKDTTGNISMNMKISPISDNRTEAEVHDAVKSAFFAGEGEVDLARVAALLVQPPNPFSKKDVQVFLSLIGPYVVQR
ncbi:hypothetical protein GQF01_11560 [Paenibacillus sp. 5J-6]|uniref:Carboxypeptidase regulatory-like domain-containing protein n=1 Tax=Paenibacillus silvestris TaxID=2606219 RepID=A0A6L8UWX5_9BACL|nr:carboxypeptidase-like regulatory domain-containing protein [Paenibacillus silvestris]MZQ82738.1 hypothetical protein [Paenibacillus silvestris]